MDPVVGCKTANSDCACSSADALLSAEVFHNGSVFSSLDGNFNPLQKRRGSSELSDIEVLA